MLKEKKQIESDFLECSITRYFNHTVTPEDVTAVPMNVSVIKDIRRRILTKGYQNFGTSVNF
jgi:hypothetical protein